MFGLFNRHEKSPRADWALGLLAETSYLEPVLLVSLALLPPLRADLMPSTAFLIPVFTLPTVFCTCWRVSETASFSGVLFALFAPFGAPPLLMSNGLVTLLSTGAGRIGFRSAAGGALT